MKKIFSILLLAISASSLSAQNYHVLGIGAPAMDILMSVDDEFLLTVPGEKGGSQPIDWTGFSDIMHRQNLTHNVLVASGGSAANTTKALASLHQKCAFFGKVGNDQMGSDFSSRLVSFGTIPLLIPTQTPTTQVAALVTPDGQRTFRFFLGASKELTENDLTPGLFENVKIVHIELYLLGQGNLVETAMKMAKEAGALVSIDLASFEVVKQYRSYLIDLIPHYVDIVFSNEDEIRALTGMEPEQGGEFLRTLCPIAVVKLGKHGCWVITENEKLKSPGIRPSCVKDTTGAGDHFAAGFLYGVLNGHSMEKSAYFANLLGSAAVEVYGAEIPQERWNELRALILE